jgi:hypothetical protein
MRVLETKPEMTHHAIENNGLHALACRRKELMIYEMRALVLFYVLWEGGDCRVCVKCHRRHKR